MENKKILKAVVLVTVSIVLFVLTYLAIMNRKNQASNNNADQMAGSAVVLPSQDCSGYGSDQDAYAKAIESADMNICECVKDEESKNACKYTANDLVLYLEAVNQYDSRMCERIQDSSRKEACVAVTKSGMDNLKENDPQYLADVHAHSHSEQAISEYESLLQNDPNNVDNLIVLSLAYAERGLNEQVQGRDQTPYAEKALIIAGRAKTIDATNAEAYRAEGYAYEIKPDYGQAIVSYNKAIELDPKNILAYTGRGHVNNMLGSLENALADFKKAAEMDVDKKEIAVYSNLCRLESSRDDLIGDAIKNCKIVAEGNFQDPVFKSESSQILATIYIKNKDYTHAENYFMKAKNFTPNDSNLYVALSDLYIHTEDYAKSEENAREAVRLSPTKASARKALAYSLYRQKKYQEAIQEANSGLQLVKNDVSLLGPNKSAMNRDLYYVLANIYHMTGNTKNETTYKEMGDKALIN